MRKPFKKTGVIDTPLQGARLQPSGAPDWTEVPLRNGYTLSYKGKTLLSRIDPVNQALRVVNALSYKERTLYVCPSPLYAYGIETLLEKLGKDSAVLCIEADNELFSLSSRNMAELLAREKETLCLVKVEESCGGALCALVSDTWGKRRFRRVEVLRLNGGWQLFPELYEGLVSDLRRDMALAWGNAMTLIRLGRLYCRNLLMNLPLLPRCETIASLNYGADPVLVLGAGPSLDGILKDLELHWGNRLKNPEERPFRIICADTCILPLKDRNIMPDLVVILESQHWNLRDFIGAVDWGVPAGFDISALPASTRVLGGRRYFFSTPWTDLSLLNRMEQRSLLPPALTPLGSVGLAAMELALRLSSGPVLSAGIDFSFSVDAYHARSTPGHKTKLSSLNRLQSPLSAHEAFREGSYSLPSKQGSSVRSDPALRNYRALFEEEFGGNKRVFEIRSSGLHLGCEILSLDEAQKILSGGKVTAASGEPPSSGNRETFGKKLESFVIEERNELQLLKDALSGRNERPLGEIEEAWDTSIDKADYLWAHFPECAGAGGNRPPAADLSFLKRIRAEIDPFLKLWDRALREISSPQD